MTTPATIENPRWLCSGCGAEYPMDGPAYPVCSCGLRCRMPTGDGLVYVGSPSERLTNALEGYERTYGAWVALRERLRESLGKPFADDPYRVQWQERWLRTTWGWAEATAHSLRDSAVELDRVEREVGACG